MILRRKYTGWCTNESSAHGYVQPWTDSAGALSSTNFWVNTPICCPSRATLLSGKFQHNNRVDGVNPEPCALCGPADRIEPRPAVSSRNTCWLTALGVAGTTCRPVGACARTHPTSTTQLFGMRASSQPCTILATPLGCSVRRRLPLVTLYQPGEKTLFVIAKKQPRTIAGKVLNDMVSYGCDNISGAFLEIFFLSLAAAPGRHVAKYRSQALDAQACPPASTGST